MLLLIINVPRETCGYFLYWNYKYNYSQSTDFITDIINDFIFLINTLQVKYLLLIIVIKLFPGK